MTEQKKPSALAKMQASNRGLVLHNMDDMWRFSNMVIKSAIVPSSYKTPEQVMIGLQAGMEVGLKPMQALNSIYVVKNKPTIWGDAMLGLVKNSGRLKEFEEKIEGEGDLRTATTRSVDINGIEIISSFSVKDAKLAGLWGKAGPWKTHPDRMLKYKARAFNLRDNFGDILMGMHMTEEMQGEEYEEFDTPSSDVPPRAERRKPVQDAVVTDVSSDKDGSKEADGDTVLQLYDRCKENFCKEAKIKGYEEDDFDSLWFEFCMEVLMCNGDDVDSPDKFTADMILTLCQGIDEFAKGNFEIGGGK